MDDLRPPPPPPVPQLPEPVIAPELEQVPWRGREGFLIVIFALVTGGFFSILAVTMTKDRNIQTLLATICLEGSLGVWVWLWVKLRHNVGLSRLVGKPSRGDVGAGSLAALLGLAAGWAITALVLSITGAFTDREVKTPEQLPTLHHGAEIFLAGIAVVIVAPIAEELFFRGFLYQAFRRWRGVPQGVLLSAFVFALAHVSPIIIPSIFALGVILAFLFERRSSLVATISAHMVYNLIGFILILATGASS